MNSSQRSKSTLKNDAANILMMRTKLQQMPTTGSKSDSRGGSRLNQNADLTINQHRDIIKYKNAYAI